MADNHIDRRCWFGVALVLTIGVVLVADDWVPPAAIAVRSKSGDVVLRISKPDVKSIGNCHATMIRSADDGTERVLWSRNLINNTAPVNTMVTNDAKYTVTFDEWERPGFLPLVIYGPKGELVAVHNLDSLEIDAKSIPDAIRGTAGFYWLRGAKGTFIDNERYLLIWWLNSGQRIVELASGQVIHEPSEKLRQAVGDAMNADMPSYDLSYTGVLSISSD